MRSIHAFSKTTMVIIPAILIFQTVNSGVSAAILVNNGGFESGLAGWTTDNQLGSDGGFSLQTGGTSPLSGTLVPSPPHGANAAMSDQVGAGGSHILYQDLSIPNTPQGLQRLFFQLFVGNRAVDFYAPNAAPNPNPATTPNSLDWATPALNQQARVDLVRVTNDPFTMATGDILQTIFQTRPGDPLVTGYNLIAADISAVIAANLGQTIRLRFAAVENVNFLQMGVDGVEIRTVPEPSSWAMFILVPVVGAVIRRRSLRT